MTTLIFFVLLGFTLAQAVQIRAPASDTNLTDPSSTQVLSVISTKSNFSAVSPDGKTLFLYNNITSSFGVYDVSNLQSPILSSSITIQTDSKKQVYMVISPDSKIGYIVYDNDNQGQLLIVDLSDILSPVTLSTYSFSKGSGPIVLSPDGQSLFVYVGCPDQANGTSFVMIIDVSSPISPKSYSVYDYPSNSSSCDISSTVLYQRSADSLIYIQNDWLEILNISNLADPQPSSSAEIGDSALGFIVSPDGKTAFLIEENENNQYPLVLTAWNVTDPFSSIGKIISLVLDPNIDASCLGTMAISHDGNYIFMAGYDKLLVVDVSDIMNMNYEVVDTISAPTFLTLSSDGRTLFVTSDTQVTIVELYIDAQSRQMFTLPSNASIQQFSLQAWSWDFLDIVISSDQNTAFTVTSSGYFSIYNVSNKTLPTLISWYEDPQSFSETSVSLIISSDEKTAFVAFPGNLFILNISNMTSPTFLNMLPSNTYNNKFAMTSDGKIIFLPYSQGFQILNVSDPSAPTNISMYNISGYIETFTLSQDEKSIYLLCWEGLYYYDGSYELQTIDISNLTNPKMVTSFNLTYDGNDYEWFDSVSVSPDNKVVFINRGGENDVFQVFDISNPALPIEVDWSDLNINTSQPVIISSDNSTVFIATLQELLVIDITRLATPEILRSYPIIDAASMFLSDDESTIYLAALNGVCIAISLQPQYALEMWSHDFVLGEVYSNTLEAFQINQNRYLNPMDRNYSFTTMSLYSTTSLPGTNHTETVTTYPLLPNWIEVDQSHGIVTFTPNSQDQIGLYQIYSALSFQIPDDIFVNASIANITNKNESIDLIVSLMSLGYMNTQSFLTSSYNPNTLLYLSSQYSPFESAIRGLLSQYYVEMTTSFAVDSSLILSASQHISINTHTENTISMTISISRGNGTQAQAQFVQGNYPILATYSSDLSSLTMEGTLTSINNALKEIIINLDDETNQYNGTVIVSDGLNPTLTQNITNISNYFALNQPPRLSNVVQGAINQVPIYTGEQFIISINGSFVDSNGQNLEYSVAMQDNTQQVPDWLTFRDSSLVGTPPEQVTDSEINIVIIAKNQFKSSQQPATLNIKISMLYALKLIGTYGGAMITVIGFWIYMSTIRNILCKKRYRYPKDFYIKVGDEQSVRNICAISFIAKEIRASNIVLNEIKNAVARECNIRRAKDSHVAAYFFDSETRKLDVEKLVNMTRNAMLKLGDMAQYDESSITQAYLRKDVIQLVVFDKILRYQLALTREMSTRYIFESVKEHWNSFIETTNDPLKYRLNIIALRKILKDEGILKFRSSPQSSEVVSNEIDSINAEDSIEANDHQANGFDEELSLTEKREETNQTPLLKKTSPSPRRRRNNLNFDLLVRLLICWAFKYHNLDYNAYDIKVVINQKPIGNKLLLKTKKLFKRELAVIEFAGKGEAAYGIRYEVKKGVLRLYGVPEEDLTGETLIVQVTTKRGWILRELWLNCVAGSVRIGNSDL